MPDFLWTPEQKTAIETVSGDVLVTAAAGAGKTAVLTQRCIHLLTNIKPPCSIDEILVLTYTEAAAAEMRRRIRSALYEQSFAQPRHPHLRRQLALLRRCLPTKQQLQSERKRKPVVQRCAGNWRRAANSTSAAW